MASAENRPVSRALAGGAVRHSFVRTAEVMPMPNLNNVQRDSFDWFLKTGLTELFAEISPTLTVKSDDVRSLDINISGFERGDIE